MHICSKKKCFGCMIKQRESYKKQKLLALRVHLVQPRCHRGVCAPQLFSSLCCVCFLLFVFFLCIVPNIGCVSGLSINWLCFWIVYQWAVFLDCLSIGCVSGLSVNWLCFWIVYHLLPLRCSLSGILTCLTII